jgi:sigma-B regulation protein RsbU (phosphoserine phosphatase)
VKNTGVIAMNLELPLWMKHVEGILETLNEGVLIVDDEDRVLFTNSVFAEMTGFARADMAGRHAMQLFVRPEDYEVVMEVRKKAYVEGRARMELLLPRRDRRELPVIVSGRTVRDVDGRQYAITTFVDISEQRQAQEALRTAYARLEKRQKETERELQLAARIQQSLTPKPLVWGSIRVDTSFHPTKTIGGDFGLIAPLDEEYLNLVVCDVVGHGISSALLANRIYVETNTLVRGGTKLPEMLEKLNHLAIHQIGSPGFFFTLAAMRIDRNGKHMEFAGAGHPPAMLVRPGEEPLLLHSQSMILGALPNAVNGGPPIHQDVAPGDRLVLYTDGITDVFDSRDEILGVAGLQKIVGDTSLLPLDQMKHAILDRIAAWSAGPCNDDISLVLVEII